MKFENTRIFNFEGALRGMRNPMNSWDKSDSEFNGDCEQCDNDQCNKCYNGVIIGDNDMTLAKKLINAGSEHRKFLRQIMVSVDITAPLYYWKEFDTYKVGTTANSTSTMHKLSTTPITLDCFETDDFEGDLPIGIDLTDIGMLAKDNICYLELIRKTYLETQDKRYWKELIRWLPESWLQTRTITISYENVYHIYSQRQNHKLTEWHQFCDWCETLPYFKEFFL